MKYITFLLLITFFTSCITTRVPNPRYAIKSSINFENISADQIFDKTEMWMARTFVDARSVLEVKNRDGKMIYGNGIINIDTKFKTYKFETTWEIHINEGMLKCEISNIQMAGYYKDGYELKKYFFFFEDDRLPKNVKDKFHKKIEILIQDLKSYVQTPVWN